MNLNPFTIRTIPENFRSVVFDDGNTLASRAVSWDFDIRGMTPHPCIFVARQDLDAAAEAGTLNRRTRTVTADTAVVSHLILADRLARAIVLATTSPSDPRTLTASGQRVGVSRGALCVWCKAAGVSARSCLDFLRILRAVILAEKQAWDLLSMLDVVDQRSLNQLLDRGGIRELCELKHPTVDQFLIAQRFLTNQQVLRAVTLRMKSSLI